MGNPQDDDDVEEDEGECLLPSLRAGRVPTPLWPPQLQHWKMNATSLNRRRVCPAAEVGGDDDQFGRMKYITKCKELGVNPISQVGAAAGGAAAGMGVQAHACMCAPSAGAKAVVAGS